MSQYFLISQMTAAGIPGDTAQSYFSALTTGSYSGLTSMLLQAGGGDASNMNLAAVQSQISETESDISALAEYDPNSAANLSWDFDLARVALSAYNPSGYASIVPSGFALQNSQSLSALGINFDTSLLNTEDGYSGALYYYSNTSDPNDPNNGTFVLADRGTINGQDWDNNISNLVGSNAPLYNDAVLAAEELNDALPDSSPLLFVGHSLGGGLAIDQAYATGLQAVVFNSAVPSAPTLGNAMQYADTALGSNGNANISNTQLQNFEASDNVQSFNTSGDPLTFAESAIGESLPSSTTLLSNQWPLTVANHMDFLGGFDNYIWQRVQGYLQ